MRSTRLTCYVNRLTKEPMGAPSPRPFTRYVNGLDSCARADRETPKAPVSQRRDRGLCVRGERLFAVDDGSEPFGQLAILKDRGNLFIGQLADMLLNQLKAL